MTCPECEFLLAGGQSNAELREHLHSCGNCRALAEDLGANATILSELKAEPLPAISFDPPSRSWAYGFAAAAAAAILIAGLLVRRTPSAVKPLPGIEVADPQPSQQPRETVIIPRQKLQPLKIKMLTPDPDVVVYWLIDN